MAKEYKDQILDTSVNEKRVYNIVDSDGNIVAENVSLEDKTVYSQEGTEFGAQEVNEIYEAIDEVNQSLTPCTQQIVLGELTANGDMEVDDISQYKYIEVNIVSTSGYGGTTIIPVEFITLFGSGGTDWASINNGMNPTDGYWASFNYRFSENTIHVRNILTTGSGITVHAIFKGIK